MSVNPSSKRSNPLDISDIDGARPHPDSFIMRKQQLLYLKNDHPYHSSCAVKQDSPEQLGRRFDSSRYMRVADIEDKNRPGKIVVEKMPPAGFKEDTTMMEYAKIPKQVKLLAQRGRLPFTRRYTKEKFGDETMSRMPDNILHHVDQTHNDHDPHMKTRRFKADVRRSEPGAYSSVSSSSRSLPRIDEVPGSVRFNSKTMKKDDRRDPDSAYFKASTEHNSPKRSRRLAEDPNQDISHSSDNINKVSRKHAHNSELADSQDSNLGLEELKKHDSSRRNAARQDEGIQSYHASSRRSAMDVHQQNSRRAQGSFIMD